MKFSSLSESFPSNILQILEARRFELMREGREAINLSAGTPDLPPAKHVMDALIEAAADPENYKYALIDTPELIEAVSQWYERRYGVRIEKGECASVYGTQEGMAHIFHLLCDPGDLVIVGTPGYPIFSFGPLFAKAKLYKSPLKPENGFLFDFESIDSAAADKAKVIIASYPSNPLAAVANDDFYLRLIAFAKKRGLIVIHDNAYSEFVHSGNPGGSFLQYPGAKEVGIEFNSLSKSHNLTGLRISFALGNRQIISEFSKLRSQIDYGISLIDQKAAVAALTGPQDAVEENRRAYRLRRDVFCKALQSFGWDVPFTPATMFTWFPLPHGGDSLQFCMDMLERTGVISVPGSSFGEGGEGWVRFALVQPPEVLAAVAARFKERGVI
ncbi:MAG: aminotransferase class I/II-fold pyridoxal phosphate-dependent enzyme [Clostridiales bacterium]|jgi:LL-diaminopimelate aminotransferase|nr:aminotransferase class I/II-fold pyridoxal phosphate-dependent enzyme [Clostridiales bacterium]